MYTKNYRFPKVLRKESYSFWSSPIWVVPKKLDASNKQKYRMVVDYRKLNQKIERVRVVGSWWNIFEINKK